MASERASRRGLFVGGAPFVLAATGATVFLWWWFTRDEDDRSGKKIPLKDIDQENAKMQPSKYKFDPDVGQDLSPNYYYNPNWTPAALAGELYAAMNQPTVPGWDGTPRSKAWFKLAYQNPDSLAMIHNYWLDNIHGDSLYYWIDWEYVLPGSIEAKRKREALEALAEIHAI